MDDEEEKDGKNELDALAVPIPSTKTIQIWGNPIQPGDKFVLPSVSSSSSSESEDDEKSHSFKRSRPKWRNVSDDDDDDDASKTRTTGGGALGTTWQWFGIFLAFALAVGGALFYPQQPIAQAPLTLWLSPHNMKSEILDLNESFVRPLVSQMHTAFGLHLGHGLDCLCMHHFRTSSISSRVYRICGTTQIRGPLVNPELVGRGNETDYWNQQHVGRCARHRTVWLRWHDVASGQQMYGRFEGAASACMQLAMEEMDGTNKICT